MVVGRYEFNLLWFQEDSDVRCSPMLIEGKLVTHCDDNARTLHEFFLRGLKESSENS